MEFGDGAEVRQLRDEIRAWLATSVIEREPGEADARFLQRWHQALYRGGWVGLSWPVEFGGRGLAPSYEAVVNEEIGAAGAPDAPRIGYLGRAILDHGRDEQRDRYLAPLLRGEDFWCQGFSEPGAGSDLAAISTRAVRDGDDYVIDGQKVWTSYAEYSDLCLLLARTGEPGGRHRGITAFIVPMDTPGVEVRPLRANTGDAEFCEVFLSGVRVPAGQRLGEEGDGWAIAMMTVSYERGAADVGYLSKFGTALGELRDALGPRIEEPAVARELGRLAMYVEVLKQHVQLRMQQRQGATSPPGPEMSIDKELMTTVDQALHEGAVRLLGADVWLDHESPWLARYLYSRGASIYGGSQQIQRNIIAQRLLGLPR